MISSHRIIVGLISFGLAFIASPASQATEVEGFDGLDQSQRHIIDSRTEVGVELQNRCGCSEDVMTPTDSSPPHSPPKGPQKHPEIVIDMGTPDVLKDASESSAEVGKTLKQVGTELPLEDEQRIISFLDANGRPYERDAKGNFKGLGGLAFPHYPALSQLLKHDSIPRTLPKWSNIRLLPNNIASAVVSLLPGTQKIKKGSVVFWPRNESGWIEGSGTRRLIYGSRGFADGVFTSISLAQQGIFWGFCIYQIIYARPFSFWALFDIIDNKSQSGIRSFIQLVTKYPAVGYGIIPALFAVPTALGSWKAFSASAVTTPADIQQQLKERKHCKDGCCFGKCCQPETESELEAALKKLKKSTKKEDRGYCDKIFRDVVAPLLGLPIAALNPTVSHLEDLVRFLLWDRHTTDRERREEAFLAIQILAEKGWGFSRIVARKALAQIASGINIWEYPAYATPDDPKSDFAVRDLALKVRAFEDLWREGNRTPLAVWRERKGFFNGIGHEILWFYTNAYLWDIGHSPYKVMSAAFWVYNVGTQVLGWMIIKNILQAWNEYKDCPDREFSFKLGDYTPTSLDYSPKCFNKGFLGTFNQLPGQPGHTLTDDLSKFHFPAGTIDLDFTAVCAKTPVTSDVLAAILRGFYQNKPELMITSFNVSGCDLSDSNGLNGTIALGRAIALHPGIQSVNMSGCGIEFLYPAPELLSSFGNMTQLARLDLHKNVIGHFGGVKLLGQSIPSTVAYLDVSSNVMQTGMRDLIQYGICRQTGLTYLDISGNAYTSTTSYIQGIECIKPFPLTVLKASGAGGHVNDTIALGNALPPTLIELDISGLAQDVNTVAEFFTNLPSGLKTLKIRGVHLESAGNSNGTISLSQHFPPQLEYFDGTRANIGLAGDGSADRLLAAFPSTLKNIYLECGWLLTNSCITQITPMLPAITSGNLQVLDLNYNQLQDPTQISALVSALAQAKTKNPSLTIDLSMNNIGLTPLDNTTLLTMGQVFSSPTTILFPQQYSPISSGQLDLICTDINDGRSLSQYSFRTSRNIDQYFSQFSSTSLNLSGKLTDADATTLTHLMNTIKTLPITSLDMSGNLFYTDDSFVSAIAGVGFPPSLKSLNFGGNLWITPSTQNLTVTLGQLSSLETLIWRGNGMTKATVQSLQAVLMSLPHLKTLDLTGSPLGPQGLVIIAESFNTQKNPTTQFNPTTLLLGSTGLGSGGALNQNDTIAFSDAFPQSSVEVLDLSTGGFLLPNTIYPELAETLPPTLKDVTFSYSSFAPGASQSFGIWAQNASALTTIDFTGVGGLYPEDLAVAFQGGWRPTHLVLSTTGIGNNVTTAFQFATALPSSVEVLKLDSNPLESGSSGSVVVEALGHSMSAMKNLRRLSLINTGLGTSGEGKGFQAMGIALANKTSLELVDISSDPLGGSPNSVKETADVDAGLLTFLNGVVSSTHSCVQFNSFPLPEGAWTGVGSGGTGALDAAYALERTTIIKACQDELCHKKDIGSYSACNATGNVSLSASLSDSVTSGASRSGGIIIDLVNWFKSFVPSSKANPAEMFYPIEDVSQGSQAEAPEDLLRQIHIDEEVDTDASSKTEPFPDFLNQMQVEDLVEDTSSIEESSIAQYFAQQQPEPTTWFGWAVGKIKGAIDDASQGLADVVGNFARDVVEGAPSYFPKNAVVSPWGGTQTPYAAAIGLNATTPLLAGGPTLFLGK